TLEDGELEGGDHLLALPDIAGLDLRGVVVRLAAGEHQDRHHEQRPEDGGAGEDLVPSQGAPFPGLLLGDLQPGAPGPMPRLSAEAEVIQNAHVEIKVVNQGAPVRAERYDTPGVWRGTGRGCTRSRAARRDSLITRSR